MRIKSLLQGELISLKVFANKIILFHMVPLLMIAIQIPVVILTFWIGFFPGEDVMLSIIGTCAQIVAGLYGITMAGYTFFLSRMDVLTESDGTLDFVVGSIKNRFKYLIWWITANVLMVLLISIVLMYCPVPHQTEMHYFYRLICNEFLVFVVFSIALILYYSLHVTAPNVLRKEATKLKQRLGGRSGAAGDVLEFLSDYATIQTYCNALLPELVLKELHKNKGCHFELTLELLKVQYPHLKPLLYDLNHLHRYYECVVNSSSMSVSLDMCLMAKKVLFHLEQMQKKQPLKIAEMTTE